MIKEIRLQHWKSFEDATLYIDPLTVLIGSNASGKSNALDALVFLQRISLNNLDTQTALGGNEIIEPIRGGINWAVMKSHNQFQISVTQIFENLEFKLSDQKTLEITNTFYIYLQDAPTMLGDHYSWVSNYKIKDEWQKKTQSLIISLENKDCFSSLDYVNLYSKIIEYRNSNSLKKIDNNILHDFELLSKLLVENDGDSLSFKELQKFFIFNPIPSKMRHYSRFSRKLLPDASNLAGFLAALSEQHKTEIEQALSKYLNHLPEKDIRKVWAEPVGRLGSDAMLYCEEEWIEGKTQIIDAHSMSDGTLRFLAILTALLTRPEGSLLVIEEIDNGLHPSRMKLLIQAMREIGSQRKIDILVTTHNPALLDGLEPEMMPFVQVVHRDPKTGTSKITPLDELDNLPKLMASGSLGTITTSGDLEQSLKIQEAEHG
ncbi:MAG: AAA family ATPase [Thiotrichaceae bacterium]|nr:AAA family ATPase [Thiotrichaceae bacterium]